MKSARRPFFDHQITTCEKNASTVDDGPEKNRCSQHLQNAEILLFTHICPPANAGKSWDATFRDWLQFGYPERFEAC